MFILIENQAEPDELMSFRALRYVVMIYERQLAAWLQTHPNARGFRFHPVMPIVVYTGRRTWPNLPPFRSLVEESKRFGRRLPEIEPLFIDLARVDTGVLQSKVGLLGWVLWLIQQSKRKRSQFATVLREVTRQLDTLPDARKQRWEELLWFAHALVYHSREGEERDQCAEYIRETVRTARQPEVSGMKKTIAQELMEEGSLKGQRESLLLLLRKKYKVIPPTIEATIEATSDRDALNGWMIACLDAKKLSEISFNGGT